ncbi:MAG: dienelactone hydrolase family protein [Candidatus Marinimicrobia bacterium]|nr:dienelactone hydrolase family protein [Candidatus Neomarinimicrobiota bacterium]
MKRNRQNLTQLFIIVLLGSLILGCSGIQQGKDLAFKTVNRGQLLTDAAKAYRAGDFAEAGKYYKKILVHNQDDAIVAYNLACCYALQGDASNASIFVTHAFQNGFRGLEIFIKDTDFDLVREDPEFQKTTIDIKKRFHSIGTRDYVEASSMLPYRMRLPKDYDASKSYPLLIGMHGMGGNSEGFISQYDKLVDPQIIYVAPEGQYPLSMHMGAQWHRRKWSINDIGKKAWNASDNMVSDYILKTIKKVSGEYKISDVYIMGFSEGAVYAYTIGLKNPDKIKGVIGFSGYLMDTEGDKSILTQQDIETGKDVRLYMAHGVDDAAIKVETARELKKMFESKGFDLTYTEFEGRHGIKADVFNDAVQWMQL